MKFMTAFIALLLFSASRLEAQTHCFGLRSGTSASTNFYNYSKERTVLHTYPHWDNEVFLRRHAPSNWCLEYALGWSITKGTYSRSDPNDINSGDFSGRSLYADVCFSHNLLPVKPRGLSPVGLCLGWTIGCALSKGVFTEYAPAWGNEPERYSLAQLRWNVMTGPQLSAIFPLKGRFGVTAKAFYSFDPITYLFRPMVYHTAPHMASRAGFTGGLSYAFR